MQSGRKSLNERAPKAVALAIKLRGQGLALKVISARLAEKGHLNSKGYPYAAASLMNALLRARAVA